MREREQRQRELMAVADHESQRLQRMRALANAKDPGHLPWEHPDGRSATPRALVPADANAGPVSAAVVTGSQLANGGVARAGRAHVSLSFSGKVDKRNLAKINDMLHVEGANRGKRLHAVINVRNVRKHSHVV